MTTMTSQGFFLSTKQIAAQLQCSERHARDLMHEMMELVGSRYAAEDILEDSKMIQVYALYDFLKYRRALKEGLRVPEFDRARWAQTCPVVEHWIV